MADRKTMQELLDFERKFFNDPNVLMNPLEKIMVDIKTKIRHIEERLQPEKNLVDGSNVLGDGPAETIIRRLIRGSDKASDAIADLLRKQVVLVNEVDELQQSKGITGVSMQGLTQLKSQIEDLNLNGQEVMNMVRRLDIAYLQNEYDMVKLTSKITSGYRATTLKRTNGEKAEYPPECVDLVGLSSTFRDKETVKELQSESNDMKIKLETFAKKNDVALSQIKKLQNEHAGIKCDVENPE